MARCRSMRRWGTAQYYNVAVDAAATGNITISGNVAELSTANVTLTANGVAIGANVGNVGNDFTLIRATSGNITTLAGSTNNLVRGNNVLLKAQGDVGTSAATIRTSATNLAVTATTGNVYVTEANDVTLRDLNKDGVSITNNAGTAQYYNVAVDAAATGNITISGNVAELSTAN